MLEHPAGFSQTSMQTFGSTQATVSEKYTKSNQFFGILEVYKIMEDVVKYYTIDTMTVQHSVRSRVLAKTFFPYTAKFCERSFC